MKLKILAFISAFAALLTFGGCAATARDDYFIGEEIEENVFENGEENGEIEITVPEPPEIETVSYIRVNSDGVNIRSGAGAGYSKLGTAEKDTLYARAEKVGDWYKTEYKDKTVYISAKYCDVVDFEKAREDIENVIAQGARFMGVKYVYGATRLHDGNGNFNRYFTTTAFDCSSLMQYIFYKGANKLLQVNTRTQVSQGKTVSKGDIKRGDLLFFTNDSRKDKKGLERIGHVALYLGDGYILHTASDYAKIEKLSAKRQSYFIQAQRII